jgi:hypothetical protein
VVCGFLSFPLLPSDTKNVSEPYQNAFGPEFPYQNPYLTRPLTEFSLTSIQESSTSCLRFGPIWFNFYAESLALWLRIRHICHRLFVAWAISVFTSAFGKVRLGVIA